MATIPVTPDPETMPMEDLRRLAEEEARKASTGTTVTDNEEEETESPLEAEGEETTSKVFVAERSFDLGDGAGAQVFKGKGTTREEALEDLSNKLIESQKNATKRIKELKATKPVEPTVTKEQESLFSAELIATPTIAFKKLFKEVTGVDIEKFKTVTARTEALLAGQERKTIADQFVIDHPDFLDNDRNAQRLKKAVALYGEFNSENLEKAYQDLNESGLLEVKGEEASGGQEKDKSQTRIESTAEVTPSQRTKKASGLSTHRRTPVPANTEPSEDDMYSMPLDELRKRANKQLAQR